MLVNCVEGAFEREFLEFEESTPCQNEKQVVPGSDRDASQQRRRFKRDLHTQRVSAGEFEHIFAGQISHVPVAYDARANLTSELKSGRETLIGIPVSVATVFILSDSGDCPP